MTLQPLSHNLPKLLFLLVMKYKFDLHLLAEKQWLEFAS